MSSSYVPHHAKDLVQCKTSHGKDSYKCPRCDEPLSPDNKDCPTGNRFACKTLRGCGLKLAVVGESCVEILALDLFSAVATAPPSSIAMPPITKEKQEYSDRVTRSQMFLDIGRQYFPADVEPTEWLHVDAVMAGIACYKNYDACNATIIGSTSTDESGKPVKPFRVQCIDRFGGEKWYHRRGANSYYSRQLIEAFCAYSGKPFDWGAALAVSPIVSSPPESKKRKASSAIVKTLSTGNRPEPTPTNTLSANRPISIDSNIAPTLAEFAQAVADGRLPTPDVEFMGVPLYRASTLSRFKTGGSDPKDFTTNWAKPVDIFFMSTGIPSELSALAEYSGVEFYRVEGATDHRLAIGIKAGGRSRDEGTLRHALAQSGFIMKPSEKHLVTAWLALDYLGDARDNKALASHVKGIKDRGLELQLNSEAQRLEDPAVGNDGIKAALVPELRRELDAVKDLVIQSHGLIMQGQKDNEMGFKRIESIIVKLQSTITGLEHWNPTGYQESVEWLSKINALEHHMAGLGTSVDEIHQMIGDELRNKRDRVSYKVRDLHVRFVYFRYHGHCPVTNAKIVGEDPVNGDPVLLNGDDGKPLGQVDHNFQVNRAGKLSTWLIESGLNQKLNHDEKERIKVQTYFTAYQQSLEEYDCPLFNLAA